jgi:hypothetical protein
MAFTKSGESGGREIKKYFLHLKLIDSKISKYACI